MRFVDAVRGGMSVVFAMSACGCSGRQEMPVADPSGLSARFIELCEQIEESPMPGLAISYLEGVGLVGCATPGLEGKQVLTSELVPGELPIPAISEQIGSDGTFAIPLSYTQAEDVSMLPIELSARLGDTTTKTPCALLSSPEDEVLIYECKVKQPGNDI